MTVWELHGMKRTMDDAGATDVARICTRPTGGNERRL
jgi:hypothetical protein